MLKPLLAAASLGLVLAVLPGTAVAAPEEQAAEPLTDLTALMRELEALAEKKEYTGAIAKLDKALSRNPLPGKTRGILQYLRAYNLLQADRDSEALEAITEAAAMFPEPSVYDLQAAIQRLNGRHMEASQTIVLIADRFPDTLAEMDFDSIRPILASVDETTHPDARFELVLSLANRDYNGGFGPGGLDWLKAEAIRGLIQRGRMDEAKSLLQRMVDSEAILNVLIDRRYEPLWPLLEERAGRDLGKQLEAELAAQKAEHLKNPTDLGALTAYHRTLRATGRSAEAVELARALTADAQQIEAAGKRAFWLANDQAYALADAGRVDEADALMAKLVALDVEKYPELISMAINRGAILMNYRRPEAALKAASWVDEKGQHAISAFGRMWNMATKACALAQLGRDAEAAAVLKAMEAMRNENKSAYLQSLVCLNRLDDAEKVVLERLADAGERDRMLRAFQNFTDSDQPSFLAGMMARLKTIRDRPAVRSAIEAHGRVLKVSARSTYWGHF